MPDYRCTVPQCENVQNATYFGNGEAYVNLTLSAIGYEVKIRKCSLINVPKVAFNLYKAAWLV